MTMPDWTNTIISVLQWGCLLWGGFMAATNAMEFFPAWKDKSPELNNAIRGIVAGIGIILLAALVPTILTWSMSQISWS